MDREHERCVVVLVEDEALIRLIAVIAFQDADFEVLEAASTDEAMRILQEHENIHLIFTDVTLPGPMDGFDLAHHVSRHRPEVRIIVTSGRPRPARKLPEGSRFVPKPYRSDEIVRHARELTGDVCASQPAGGPSCGHAG